MDWLNYHHLLYFWVAAREGSITRASEKLMLAQPTVSGQIRALEKALDVKLFERRGREIALTETGGVVFAYANEIFSMGQELLGVLQGGPSGQPPRLRVGLAAALPKLVMWSLLRPVIRADPPVQLVCREDKADRLLTDLAAHAYDVVLSDSPAGTAVSVRATNHHLGGCAIGFFGVAGLASTYQRGFPKSLHGAPLVLPTANTALRRSLDRWFDAVSIRPKIPVVVERDIIRQYQVVKIGEIQEVQEQFYAITVERKIKNPAVVLICDRAREMLSAIH
ncbi:MAG: LysR family transcriptional regulator [Planctomycetota bacterium]|jgi:LysR family transcriptional activator of nhaA